MSRPISSRNHTILCLLTVYTIHGVLFHVLSSPQVFVTNIIMKPVFLRSIDSKTRTSSNTSFHNQSYPAGDSVRNNDSVHLSFIYDTHEKKNIEEHRIRNVSHSSSSDVPLSNNVLSKKKKELQENSSNIMDIGLSSKWIQDFLNSTTSSAASCTLTVMTFLFPGVTIMKILSPSAWGFFTGCLIFVFISTDCEREVSSR